MKRKAFCMFLVLIILFMCGVALAYVGNRNSRKFHYDGCSSVRQMKESNKVYIGSREEAIRHGYVPCQRCRP